MRVAERWALYAAVLERAQGLGVDMPITGAVVALRESSTPVAVPDARVVWYRAQMRARAEATRRAVRAWGLELLCVNPAEYSNALTAVLTSPLDLSEPADTLVLPYREIWSSGVMERAKLFNRVVIAADVGGLGDQAPEGNLDMVMLCHGEHYVTELRHIAPTSGLIYIDGDTSMSPGTWEAVMRGVGGAGPLSPTAVLRPVALAAERAPALAEPAVRAAPAAARA